MDELIQALSLPSSLQQLLEELEHLTALEAQQNGNPWLSIDRVAELFHAKYGMSPEQLAIAQGYGRDLRILLKESGRFSIYGTPLPHEFYVALIQAVVFDYPQAQTSPKSDKAKQAWKASSRSPRKAKGKDAEERVHCQTQSPSRQQDCLVPEISSVNDLELALIEIIRSLTATHPNEVIALTLLSYKFSDRHHQPIRAVMRRVCPDMRLAELLQTVPGLEVQRVNDDWQVNLVHQNNHPNHYERRSR
ncbi:MAG TPA: hypothetical protein V6C84_00795 [Coleofasciculaceae cyanobacterium]|jgi:hypothetical protein